MGYPGPCMSVGASHVLSREGYAPAHLLAGWPDYGLAQVSAGQLRNLTRLGAPHDPCPQGIMLAPTVEEPWHAVVFDHAGKRTSAVCKAIAAAATWHIPLIG